MDGGNDCWIQRLGLVGKGDDGNICTANLSLRGQPLFGSDQLFSCKKAGPVSLGSLNFHKKSEVCIYLKFIVLK